MSLVVVNNCSSYRQEELAGVLNKGISHFGGWGTLLSPGKKVLLKINLIAPLPPERAACTHPELVRALVRLCRERGCEVWIGDSAGGAIAGIAPTEKAFKVGGFEEVAREEGAQIKSFDKEGVAALASTTGRFFDKLYLAKPMFAADVVINLPKLKTHSKAIYTGAVKNLFGCIPGLRKGEFHRIAPNQEDFAELIVDINRSCRVDLHIMDGVVGMEGGGPTAGDPRQVGLLLMAKDPLALDTVASRIMGLTIAEVPILSKAKEMGLGIGDLAEIKLAGDYDKVPVIKGYKLPRPYRKKVATKFMLNAVVSLFKTRPVVNLTNCRHCQMCVESCPVQVIDPKTKAIDYSKCIECLCCHELCPHSVVELKHQNMVGRRILPWVMRKWKH